MRSISGIVSVCDLEPPWAGVRGRWETYPNVGPKREGCQASDSRVLDRKEIDLLGKIVMEGQI